MFAAAMLDYESRRSILQIEELWSMTRSIHYTLAMPRPNSHLLEVTVRISDPDAEMLEFVMPTWTPGSYLIREFQRHVQDFSATNASGSPLRHRKTEKNRWRVESNGSNTVTVQYRVYSRDLTVRTNFLDVDRALINGASTFMFVEGLRDIPLHVSIRQPEGWSFVTSMRELPSGEFVVADYDELVDSPILCGDVKKFDFAVDGIPHVLAISGAGNFDSGSLVRDLVKIVSAASDLFGGLPYQRYVFFLLLSETGAGGLEHRDSNICILPRLTFRPFRSYERFLSIEAHEHFHAWMVKRIQPSNFKSWGYTAEQHTRLLWVMEGITEYYADQIMLRAGIITSERYLERLSDDISTLQRTPGRTLQSLEDSSFDTWIKYYRPDENSENTSVSYYLKGSLVAALLDLKILSDTGGKKSLDDVVRALWEDSEIRDRGINEDGFEAFCLRVSGVDLSEVFDRYVRGVEEIEWNEVLGYAGYRLETSGDPQTGRAYLGARFQRDSQYAVIDSVVVGGPAWDAGISPGDEILALDGFRTPRVEIDSRMEMFDPGDSVAIALFRQGYLQDVIVRLGERPIERYRIVPETEISESNEVVRGGWLRGPAG